jgi:2-polyprenyl-6-methoxyphenol hydroxylase-like FAD-dependent oxidoreductase
MEIYRPLGLAERVKEAGKPFDGEAGVARCTTLAGEWEWLYEDESPRAFPELSAGEYGMADQSSVEPILCDAAVGWGAEQRFNTGMVSFEAHEDSISAVLEDRSSGQQRTVRADYLVAADGNRSSIRNQLGIDRPGPGVTRHWASIVFEADLSQMLRRRAVYWIVLNPELGFASFVTTAVPGRWAVSVTYDPAKQSIADFTPQRCIEVARAAVGISDLAINVLDVGGWEEAVGVADEYCSGRVFLVGDSAHVWPPAGALGANAAVQDAHNLAWKLAAVVKGYADQSLLNSYADERRPVALELARLTVQRQAARFSNDEEYQDDLDDLLCALGQRYRSSAVVGAQHDSVFDEKLQLRGLPGERAPHLWLDRTGARISTHDLFHDSFVLLTGSAGAPWVDAAGKVAERTSVPLRAYQVGPASKQVDVIDVEDEWQLRYGVGIDGAVLVRPDGYVAWRSAKPSTNAEAQLADVLRQVLRG